MTPEEYLEFQQEQERLKKQREAWQEPTQQPQQKPKWSFKTLIKNFTQQQPQIPFEEKLRQIQQQPQRRFATPPNQNILNAHKHVNLFGGQPQQRQFQPQRMTLTLAQGQPPARRLKVW